MLSSRRVHFPAVLFHPPGPMDKLPLPSLLRGTANLHPGLENRSGPFAGGEKKLHRVVHTSDWMAGMTAFTCYL